MKQLKTLMVSELINSVNHIKKHNLYKDKYVSISGYINDSGLFESKTEFQTNGKKFVEFKDMSSGGIVRKMLDKHRLSSAHVILVCKIIQFIRIQIGHVVSISLVDENNNVIDSLSLEGNNIPIVLR